MQRILKKLHDWWFNLCPVHGTVLNEGHCLECIFEDNLKHFWRGTERD